MSSSVMKVNWAQVFSFEVTDGRTLLLVENDCEQRRRSRKDTPS